MNINRDYLIINDVKKSNIKLDNGSIFFYITDKNTQNIFVNLVINVSNNDLIQKYANIENAEDYTLTMNIVKPDNTYKIIEGKLHDKEKAIFEFDLKEDCVDKIGTYRCELLTKCNINNHEEITTSNKLTYKVKSSVLNDLDDIVEAPEYPLVIQLFDKLSDIDQYEEDRRANELARQLAEQQRQTRFDALDADMVDSIQQMDDKVVEVENRITTKEQAVDKLITDTKADIDEYKVAKDQEIDDYKITKDAEINEAIANQNTAINAQNDRITVTENNVIAQNSKLDTLETKATTHEARITAVEAKNAEQDSRLDVAENRLANIGNDITNTMQLIIDEHTSRLEAIEAIDVAQNTRLDAIEVKNQQQDDRLLDIEKVNNRQDIDIKCLYGTSQTIDVTKEGNSIYLQNSNNGFVIVDEIQGNTLVNCNKEPDKELILNGNINISGDNTVTLTEGVDGGLVDVTLEGNTMVNVCDQKDPVAITKSYTVETGNHVALQGEHDGKCRPVVTGNTLVNLASGKLLTYSDKLVITDSTITYDLPNGNGQPGTYVSLSYSLKPSTEYTIIVNVLEYTTGILHFRFRTNNSASSSETIVNSAGLNKIKLTTDSESSCTNLMIFNRGGIDNQYTVSRDIIILEGDYTNEPTTEYFEGLQSSFEDKVVTQEMVDNGEEVAENLGKYKVDYVISREDGTVGQTKTFYLNSPLLEGDTIEEKDNSIYHVHRYDKVVLDGSIIPSPSKIKPNNKYRWDFLVNGVASVNPAKATTINNRYPDVSGDDVWNDKAYGISQFNLKNKLALYLNKYSDGSNDSKQLLINELQQNPVTVVYKLASPQYEVISQNDTILCDSYVNGHLDVDSVVPIKKVEFKRTPSVLLKYQYASTTYTVQFESDNVGNLVMFFEGSKNPSISVDVVKGVNKVSLNTGNGDLYNSIHFDGIGFNASNIVVTEATDQEFGYFEGMKSVGECEDLAVVSSNSDSTQSNTQTLTHEPLRGIGDTKDKYVLIDGKWYIERNVAEVVLDGVNNVIKGILELDTTVRASASLNGFKTSSKGICDKILYKTGDSTDTEHVRLDGNGNLLLWINKTRLNNSNVDTINSYLQSNPIKIIAELSSPQYEPIDYNPFEVYSDVTHISNNSTIPCNMTIKNTGYNCLLKPSTTYTVSSNLGLNTVTTPSTLTEGCLRFYDTDTSTVTTMKDVTILEGDYTTGKPLPSHFSGIESVFEQEYDEVVGKYKVKIRVQNEDASKENYIEFYINEPLRGIGDIKDKVYVKDDKVVVERNCGQREYQDGDFGTYLTDKVNTVYPLAEPTYEEVEYNDVKLFIESFKNSTLFYDSNVPVTSKIHYSYSVPIVDTVAQTASISDEQDNMIIDLATQVAVMEMMLM